MQIKFMLFGHLMSGIIIERFDNKIIVQTEDNNTYLISVNETKSKIKKGM